MKKIVYIILAVFVFLAIGCSREEKKEIPKIKDIQAQEGIPVKIEKAQRETFALKKRFSGMLRGKKEAFASAFIGGNLAKLNVKIGDYVKEDQVIAEFAIDEAASSYRQAKAAFENTERNFNRIQALYEAGAVSKQMLDDITTKYDVDKVNLEAAYQQIYVKAPISGYIAEIYFNIGDNIEREKAIAKIADLKNLTLQLEVPEGDYLYLSKESKVAILPASKNQEAVHGHISKIAATANPMSQAFAVEISFENKDKLFRAGTIVEAEITLVEKEDVFVLLKENVFDNGTGKYIYLIENGKSQKRMVQTGFQSGLEVEVVSGLLAGDQIVIAGAGKLKPNAKVKIVN